MPAFFCHSFPRALLRAHSCARQLRVFCFHGSSRTARFPPRMQPLALGAEASRFWMPQENEARKRRFKKCLTYRPATPEVARLGRSGGSGQGRIIGRISSEQVPLRVPPSALLPVCPSSGAQAAESLQIGPFHVRVVGLPWLATSQTPQSARREDKGEAPEPAERPECPDEEEAAGGLGDLAVMCPPHVHDGHGCCEQSDEQHDDVPRSPFAEHECPVEEEHEDEQRSV